MDISSLIDHSHRLLYVARPTCFAKGLEGINFAIDGHCVWNRAKLSDRLADQKE